jgi:regulatory protein
VCTGASPTRSPFGGPVDDAASQGAVVEDAASEDAAEALAVADGMLARLLGRRELTVAEARDALRSRGVAEVPLEETVEAFIRRGYLDDARVAEQVVHISTTRKAQGRQAIAMALTRRGVARDVADEALAALGDDEAERALAFARTRVRSAAGRDRDAALRRLVGQLQRRGYSSAIAMTAARAAVDDAEL